MRPAVRPGDTVITACVVVVSLTPMKIPEAMTAGIRTERWVVHTAMISTTKAKAARLPYIVLAGPNRSCSRRAEDGETATSPPSRHQPGDHHPGRSHAHSRSHLRHLPVSGNTGLAGMLDITDVAVR